MTLLSSFKRRQVNSTATGGASAADGKFESNLEDLYAICDQIETSLRTTVDCLTQTSRSNGYMPIPPQPSKLDMSPAGQQHPDFLPYPQYIATSKQQVFSGSAV